MNSVEQAYKIGAERSSAPLLERIKVLEVELKSEREYSESLAKDICLMEDALGFKNDCRDKDGAFIPTIGPWMERVRDLIASEGELGDTSAQLDRALAAIKACGVEL